MKYEVLKDGMGKDGRSFSVGSVIELDKDYAEHLVTRGIVRSMNSSKKRSSKTKQRAVVKPDDLEQAVGE